MPALPVTALLRHTLPDATVHYDWLIARDAAGRLSLRTFRLDTRLDRLARGGCVSAEPAADHRPLYLSYEGPVAAAPGGDPSRDRGVVERVARGVVVAHEQRPPSEHVVIRWDSGDEQILSLVPGGRVWTVRHETDAAAW